MGLVAYSAFIPAKALLGQALLEQAWEKVEAGDSEARPWPWADMSPAGVLQWEDHRWVVLRGASGESLAWGPGLVEGLEAPVIGAHRDTHFRALEDVEIGDEVVWRTREGVRRYRVVLLEVADTPVARVVEGALVLSTCYPFEAVTPGPQRFVVTALPVTS